MINRTTAKARAAPVRVVTNIVTEAREVGALETPEAEIVLVVGIVDRIMTKVDQVLLLEVQGGAEAPQDPELLVELVIVEVCPVRCRSHMEASSAKNSLKLVYVKRL